jgi:hypothetical protein
MIERSILTVAFSATALLCLGWVGIGMASFGKVARKPRFTLGSAISNAGVVTISELVGTGHCLTLTSNRMTALLTSEVKAALSISACSRMLNALEKYDAAKDEDG